MTHSRNDPFTWKREPVWERVIRCIRMLALHGIISEGERDKALARAKKKYHLQEKSAQVLSPPEIPS